MKSIRKYKIFLLLFVLIVGFCVFNPVQAVITPQLYIEDVKLDKESLNSGDEIKAVVFLRNYDDYVIPDLNMVISLMMGSDKNSSSSILLGHQKLKESFFLLAKEEAKKNLNYILPLNLLSGKFIIRVEIRNGKGMMIARKEKEINISGNGKFLTLEKTDGDFNAKSDKVEFKIKNNFSSDLSVYAKIIVLKDGTILKEEKSENMTLTANEEKNQILDILKINETGGHIFEIKFYDSKTNEPVSNELSFVRTFNAVEDSPFNIIDIVCDKDIYKAGEVAKVRIQFSGGLPSIEGLADKNSFQGAVRIKVTDNKDNIVVGEIQEELNLKEGEKTIEVPIEKTTNNFMVEAIISKDGKTIADYNFSIASKNGPPAKNYIAVFFAVGLLILIILFFLFLWWKKGKARLIPKTFILFFVLLVFSFLTSNYVYAWTSEASNLNNMGVTTTITSPSINDLQNLSPGQTIVFAGELKVPYYIDILGDGDEYSPFFCQDLPGNPIYPDPVFQWVDIPDYYLACYVPSNSPPSRGYPSGDTYPVMRILMTDESISNNMAPHNVRDCVGREDSISPDIPDNILEPWNNEYCGEIPQEGSWAYFDILNWGCNTYSDSVYIDDFNCGETKYLSLSAFSPYTGGAKNKTLTYFWNRDDFIASSVTQDANYWYVPFQIRVKIPADYTGSARFYLQTLGFQSMMYPTLHSTPPFYPYMDTVTQRLNFWYWDIRYQDANVGPIDGPYISNAIKTGEDYCATDLVNAGKEKINLSWRYHDSGGSQQVAYSILYKEYKEGGGGDPNVYEYNVTDTNIPDGGTGTSSLTVVPGAVIDDSLGEILYGKFYDWCVQVKNDDNVFSADCVPGSGSASGPRIETPLFSHPYVDFNLPPLPVYTGVQVTFSDNNSKCYSPAGIAVSCKGNSSTYFWEFGDSITSNSKPNSSHSYNTGGDYTVKLTITDNGKSCPPTEKTLTVGHKPTVIANDSEPHPCDKFVNGQPQADAGRINLSWDFIEPGGSQKDYVIYIDDNLGFNNINPNMHTANNDSARACVFTDNSAEEINVYTKILPVLGCSPIQLNYGKTYYWKVMVSDAGGTWSDWSEIKNFPTPVQPYPYTKFTSPNPPVHSGSTEHFKDDSQCFSSGAMVVCKDLGASVAYAWDFGIEGGACPPPVSAEKTCQFSSNVGNTDHTYSPSSSGKTLIAQLIVTQNGNIFCQFSDDILIDKEYSIPIWIEIAPF